MAGFGEGRGAEEASGLHGDSGGESALVKRDRAPGMDDITANMVPTAKQKLVERVAEGSQGAAIDRLQPSGQ